MFDERTTPGDAELYAKGVGVGAVGDPLVGVVVGEGGTAVRVSDAWEAVNES